MLHHTYTKLNFQPVIVVDISNPMIHTVCDLKEGKKKRSLLFYGFVNFLTRETGGSDAI